MFADTDLSSSAQVKVVFIATKCARKGSSWTAGRDLSTLVGGTTSIASHPWPQLKFARSEAQRPPTPDTLRHYVNRRTASSCRGDVRHAETSPPARSETLPHSTPSASRAGSHRVPPSMSLLSRGRGEEVMRAVHFDYAAIAPAAHRCSRSCARFFSGHPALSRAGRAVEASAIRSSSAGRAACAPRRAPLLVLRVHFDHSYIMWTDPLIVSSRARHPINDSPTICRKAQGQTDRVDRAAAPTSSILRPPPHRVRTFPLVLRRGRRGRGNSIGTSRYRHIFGTAFRSSSAAIMLVARTPARQAEVEELGEVNRGRLTNDTSRFILHRPCDAVVEMCFREMEPLSTHSDCELLAACRSVIGLERSIAP